MEHSGMSLAFQFFYSTPFEALFSNGQVPTRCGMRNKLHTGSVDHVLEKNGRHQYLSCPPGSGKGTDSSYPDMHGLVAPLEETQTQCPK
jgi:hypothetical protein